MKNALSIKPGTVAELAKQLLLARADEDDSVYPRGRAVFWIGAGVSISAGLPSGRLLAGRLALRIADKLGVLPPGTGSDPERQEGAFAALQRTGEVPAELTLATAYGELFSRLDPTQQRDFIRRIVMLTNRRQINWAHLAIGELVRQRIVHTLLTTNFDDLLLDGLVRCDQLPAIIDGVESLDRIDARPPIPQLVYLHGSQHTYSPRNSTQAVRATRDLPQARGGLFGLLQQCSVLVVVGYAGNAGEGVMELLLDSCRGLRELPICWVAHGGEATLSPSCVQLLAGNEYARLIAGQDADIFFRELLREMRIGVPEWFRDPIDHVLQLAERIRVADGAGSAPLRDEIDDFRSRLRELRPFWDQVGVERRERRELRQLLLRDDYAEVWRRLAGRELDDSALIQMRADAAYELGRRGIDDLLPAAVRDGVAIVHRLPEGSAEWAEAQTRLADALATMAEDGDERAIRDAISAYDQALQFYAREGPRERWASIRHDQGLAWLTLGERGDLAAFDHAREAFNDALSCFDNRATPVQWAQTKASLACMWHILSQQGDRSRLLQAADAYAEALEFLTKDRSPDDWATALCNRAGVLLEISREHDEDAPLLDAVRSLNEARRVVSPVSMPRQWAKISNNLGAALLALGRRGNGDALRRAIEVLKEALAVQRGRAMAIDRLATSRTLGNALLALGLQGDEQALHEALDILSNAMESLRDETIASGRGHGIEELAQRVFDELTRVASRGPAAITTQRQTVGAAFGTPQASAGGSRVLVVEDDETEQQVIKAMLERSITNVVVKACETGNGALETVAGWRPDLLVLDLRLPDIPGDTVLIEIRKIHPRLPVLVYSADQDAVAKMREHLRALPTDGVAVLAKTAGQDDFIRLVPTLFKRRHRDVNVKAPGTPFDVWAPGNSQRPSASQ